MFLCSMKQECSRHFQPVQVRHFKKSRCQKESFSEQILFHFTDLVPYHICSKWINLFHFLNCWSLWWNFQPPTVTELQNKTASLRGLNIIIYVNIVAFSGVLIASSFKPNLWEQLTSCVHTWDISQSPESLTARGAVLTLMCRWNHQKCFCISD